MKTRPAIPNLCRVISCPDYTVDRYNELAWVNIYGEPPPEVLIFDLQQTGIKCGVSIKKNKADLPTKLERWFGDISPSFQVKEFKATYEIHTTSAHPGLFLDHQSTRFWLQQNAQDKTVLNLFSYTGSLGISAALGGATQSINIDLSNPSTQWAKQNAELNNLSPAHEFIKGDVFDWAKRFKKKNETFDIVISDPPSQSRSDELHFSTQKHLDLLHELCIDCVAPKGTLITSINTEMLSENVILASVQNTAQKLNRKILTYEPLSLPEGFDPNFRSMKGIRFKFSN